jgi:hypothetical protein
MARRNASFEVEQVKQLALVAGLSTHHGKPPPPNLSRRRNHYSPISAKPFSTVSVNNRRAVLWETRRLCPRKAVAPSSAIRPS